VEVPDVDEALRLMECSKESLLDDGDKDVETDRSPVSRIFRLIKQMAGSGQKPGRKQPKAIGRGRDMDVDSESEDEVDQLSMVDIRRKVLSAGFTEVQLTETINQVSTRIYLLMTVADLTCQYENLGLWVRTAGGAKLLFIENDD